LRGAERRGNPGGSSIFWNGKTSGKSVWIVTALTPSLLTSLKVSAQILRSRFAWQDFLRFSLHPGEENMLTRDMPYVRRQETSVMRMAGNGGNSRAEQDVDDIVKVCQAIASSGDSRNPAVGVAAKTALMGALEEIRVITQGKQGEEFDWARVLMTGLVGGGLGVAPEIMSAFLKKVGELIQPRNAAEKFINAAPSASNPLSLEFSMPQGGGRTYVNEVGGTRLAGQTEVRVGGRVVFVTPREQSMSLAEAAQWYREQASSIDAVLRDSDLPLELKVKQAYQLRLAQQQGAMNSLYDPELAEEFSNMFRLDSLARMEIDLIRGEKLTGDTLYEAMYEKLTTVDDNIRYPDMTGGCFIKGTRVHTREGLKRIEEIKVGDYVLSSPEDGSGKPEYKRVVNTFVHHNKTIRRVSILNKKNQGEIVVATDNHPFWVEGVGWTRADLLKADDVIRLADGSLSKVFGQVPVFKYQASEAWEEYRAGGSIGFASYAFPPMGNPAAGRLFDYGNYAIVEPQYAELSWGDMEEKDRLEVTVYNIEVEDFHTYYVSGLGIWVHNANCVGVEVVNGDPSHLPVDTQFFDTDPHIQEVANELKQGWAVAHSAAQGLRDRHTDEVLLELFREANYDASIPVKELQNWLQFEDPVVGRLRFQNKRCEYVVFYENKWGGKNFLRVEGHEIDKLGNHIFVDRKLSFFKGKVSFDDNGAPIAGDALIDAMSLLRRVSQALNDNPGMKWRFEMPQLKNPKEGFNAAGEKIIKELKADGERAKQLFEAIENGKLTEVKVPTGKQVIDEKTGNLVDEFEIVISPGEVALIKKMLDEKRIELRAVEQLTPQKQDINYEGSAYVTDLLEMSDIEWTLGEAKQYWLDAGVAASVFDGVRFSIADLPEGQAGLAEGNHITLDASGASWGWFVDDTLENSSEFILPESATSLRALSDSPAYDRIDLLTVMIHELGHVLGLPSVLASGGIMSQYLSPGLRRLPDAGIVESIPLALQASPSVTPAVMRVGVSEYQSNSQQTPPPAPITVTPYPELQNAAFADAEGWSTTGDVNFSNGTATLKESADTQTRLNQVFVVGENDRYLSFKITDLVLDDVENAPDDAFEAALIDATTGQSLLSGTGLTKNDAFLNLQANGDAFQLDKVKAIDNPDGSRTITVDLEGIPEGTVVNLSFDRIGFGVGKAATSSGCGQKWRTTIQMKRRRLLSPCRLRLP
jgi:hypothetical protein